MSTGSTLEELMGDETSELMDRQRIWECMLRYARGMDRLDVDLVLSAYHPAGRAVRAQRHRISSSR